MEKRPDQETRTESKARLVEQINAGLHSGDYSRALDLLRGRAAEFRNDAELSELEKLAQEGMKSNAEANRLITESQDLFARRQSAEAIQLLRRAYELDENNSLARAILANALVEHAHSMVETDWWEAEALAKQALALNPAHPTAKTIRGLVLDRKRTSSVEEWVSQTRKLQSSGDLFAALAWVEEGMALYPDDPKLLQIQDSIQRDQSARRRHSRRRDLEDLRRMESEIDGAADIAAKQALAGRIQGVAAKYWTDGEFLSVANGLLHRLGLVPQEGSAASPQSKGATVIFHVPRPSAPEALRADSSQVPPNSITPVGVPTSFSPPAKVPPINALPSAVPPSNVPATPPEPQLPRPQAATVAAELSAAEPSLTETSAPAAKVTSPSSRQEQPTKSTSTTLILVSTAVIVLIAAIFFFTRKHYAPAVAKTSAVPTVSAPVVSYPAIPTPTISTPAAAPATPGPSLPALGVSSDIAAGKGTVNDQAVNDQPVDDQPPANSSHSLGTLLVVAGQDDAKVFLDGRLQRQLTQAGQLRLPNLELKDYVVQVSKSGFQDPPQQKISIRKGEAARVIFMLQPQPRLASLAIQGGAPGTTILVDETLVGTIQPDGTLSVSTVNPGDHTVELRKERFKTRQFKKHFDAGGTISLAAADAVLEAAPDAALGELKITFTPADASIAIVKGDLLKMVSSGVPLNLVAGTYTLTARTAERFTRTSTLEIIAGQSKILDLSLAPGGMSKWDDPGAWKREGDSFLRTGGDFVLYGAAPASGTFGFSAMLTKGRLLQWVLNYSDSKNYVLFQMDDKNFYRSVIRNGEKTDEIIIPDKGEKKSFRTLQIRVSSTEIVHQIKHGDKWTVLDRWTQPGANLSLGKFGFYLPGSDQVALSSFGHYADLNLR